MIAVVSHAWTSDDGPAADAYIRGSEDFLDFLRAQPGFRGRMLVRSIADPTEFTNIRFFDSVDDYERMIHVDGYADLINDLGQYMRPHERAGKDYVEVVLDDLPAMGG